jgi:isopentenyl-diphosphate delta-isomerase
VSEIVQRKLSHLDLCVRGDVESRGSTLFDQVRLLHDALPELSCDEIDPSVELMGRWLQVPLLISGMTGGAPRARELNRALATGAQKFGLGMGVGSQRAMLLQPDLISTYQVRDVAPDILLLANIGAVQAREAGTSRVAELVQDEGDRDFRGCLEAIGVLVSELPTPVIVKETGCGLAPGALARLREAGVRWVDVSGSGGTTWTGVEALRGSRRQRMLGAELREWGVPTAASLVYARRAGFQAIASGGIRGALDAVRALALGAEAVSVALPFLRAYAARGEQGVFEIAAGLCEGVRALMLLMGARRLGDLRRVPRVVGPELAAWLAVPDSPRADG